MTISDKSRKESLHTALRRMREDLRDQWIGAVRFVVEDARFADLPQTTWLDLEDQSLVRTDNHVGEAGFKLTGEGLAAAMLLSGELQSAEHKERCVRLRSALKDLVKGRELSGGRTDTWSVIATTNLTDNWIFNAVNARFLERMWPDDHLEIDFRSGGRDIRIPANFGTRQLSGLQAGPL